MKLTAAFKAWLVANAGVKADATDAEFRAAAAACFTKDAKDPAYLSHEKYVELCTDPDAAKGAAVEGTLGEILSLVKSQGAEIAALKAGAPAGTATPTAATASDIEKAVAGSSGTGSLDPQVNVKRAHTQYDATRREMVFPERMAKGASPHPFAGRRVWEGGIPAPGAAKQRYIDQPSQLDMAISGAYLKFALESLNRGPLPYVGLRMTDHDRDLMKYALENYEWGGVIHGEGSENKGAMGVEGTKLTPAMQKAVLDDSSSGGLEVAPIVFDDQIIKTPLLNGEFAPAVNYIPITRGRRIEGASIGNVTLTSGGADDTNIPLFTTSSFIAAFDTTIHVVNGAIEIGLDFLSDSPIDISSLITEQYGQRLLAWLDEQICIGDGSTEPEGIMAASGTTSVSFGSAAPTVGGYESLFFGVPKRYKQGYAAERIMFGGTETSYQRARAIKVGTSDERRIFGMTYADYMLMGHKFGISDTMANTQQFYCNMARYRMYRRMGLVMKMTTEGQTLVRKNLLMISARARYGGQLEDGGAAAVTTTSQA